MRTRVSGGVGGEQRWSAATPYPDWVHMYFDSHCHLTDERLITHVHGVLYRARARDVSGMVTVASDASDAEKACNLAEREPDVWATVGVHPHAAVTAGEMQRATVLELSQRPVVVAIGETGLDYHYDNSPRAVQRSLFEWHVAVAAERRLPLVVHSRSADADTAAILRNAAQEVRGVLHCFSGGLKLLEEAIQLGWYVSFSGMVTFRKYRDGHLVRQVPLDQLLAETDSPYLAPEPERGRTNEPANLGRVVEGLARFRDEDSAKLAEATRQNAERLFGLSA